jgi:hypothetical protein
MQTADYVLNSFLHCWRGQGSQCVPAIHNLNFKSGFWKNQDSCNNEKTNGMGQLIRRGLQTTDAKSEESKSRPIICRGYECNYFLGYSAQYNVLCDGQNRAIKKICYCPVQLYHVYSPHNYSMPHWTSQRYREIAPLSICKLPVRLLGIHITMGDVRGVVGSEKHVKNF